jgi:hypothetical protein
MPHEHIFIVDERHKIAKKESLILAAKLLEHEFEKIEWQHKNQQSIWDMTFSSQRREGEGGGCRSDFAERLFFLAILLLFPLVSWAGRLMRANNDNQALLHKFSCIIGDNNNR